MEAGRRKVNHRGRLRAGALRPNAMKGFAVAPSPYPLFILLAVLALAALIGRAIATRPQNQVVLIAAGALLLALGAALAVSRRTALELFGFVILLTSGLVDWPRILSVGPVSALGATTVACATVGVLLRTRNRPPPIAARAMRLFYYFIGWATLSFLWHPSNLTVEAFQNLAVFVAFAFLASATAAICEAAPGTADDLSRSFDKAIALAVGLYLLTVILSGFEPDLILSPRAFALFALIGLARTLAKFRYESRGAAWMAIAIVGAILFSLSRTALAVSLILIPLAWLDRRSISRRVGVVLAIGLTFGALALAVASVGPLQERFSEPDKVQVAGRVTISVTGRGNVWAATWQSFEKSPWLGHGAGSSGTLPASYLVPSVREHYSHPHNDYLRLLHDYGIIGFGFWIGSLITLLRYTRRAWLAAPGARARAIHLAAFLGLVALALSIITDNTLVYIFVMAPLGILVGASLGISASADRSASPNGESEERAPLLGASRSSP
jgi:O-antigen ligase